ncbi:hypothetical protein HUT03_05360 [Candidatus Liberibacter africanus]|uniref:Transcription-repair coupling factor n=2 Tax=Liberibacter africanus TaxID=34020 RepID=A0A0G3IA20_LIBAF|nr:transcription-repair coupling factor [Candidatus Liberibacter africanus PTSAPSY]QTP64339.1 hypothetical protein HUT03_05360 [Candidatus Liberibacter africanus]
MCAGKMAIVLGIRYPEGLLQYIEQQKGKVIIRPDQSIVFDCLLPAINNDSSKQNTLLLS